MIYYIKKLSKNHIIFFSIIITIATAIISWIFSWDSDPFTGFDKLIGDVLITLFCFAIICILGIRKTAGFQKQHLGKGLIYGIPFIIIGLLASLIGNIGSDIESMSAISIGGMIMFTVNMLFVGINEEISMRSLILNNLILKYGESRKGIYKSILISSAIFGIIHLVNAFFMSPITVIVQSINAMSAGILFAVIYICSKNIWSCILIHALVDWLSLFIGQCFVGGQSVLSVDMTILQGIIMVVLGSLPLIVIANFILNRKLAKS